jgi:hypothetical protein
MSPRKLVDAEPERSRIGHLREHGEPLDTLGHDATGCLVGDPAE